MGRMILNGTVYGAGAKVEANPSEIATDTLQTVDIDGVIYDIQGGGGGSNLILGAAMYSTDEKQVGVWIDGKPLYQKTINCGALPLNAQKNIDLNVNIDNCISCEGYAISAQYGYVIYFNDAVPNSARDNVRVYITVNDDKLHIQTATNDVSIYNDSYVTIKYTKTTDATGSGGYQAYGFSPIIYSDVEREIGVYVDNKPLYQRTVVFTGAFYGKMTIGTNPVVNAETYANIIISARSEGTWRSLGFAHSDQGNNASIFISNSNDFQLRTGIDVTSAQAYDKIIITMQYTKTTDVAGSGSYNMLGVPNVHYSTDEQVIGTWIDGKPLYQKTIDTILSSNVTYIDTSMLNIKRLIEIIGQCDSNNGNNALFVPYYEDSTWRMIPGMDYANQQLSIVTTATVLQYYSKLSMTIKYTKTTD